MDKKMKTFLMVCGIIVGAGLILSMIGIALGGVRGLAVIDSRVPWIDLGSSGQQKEETLTSEKFSSIDVEADYGSLEFIASDRYAVEAKYNSKYGAPEVRVSNGILQIKDNKKIQVGISLPFIGGERSYNGTDIKIYYPKETIFDRVDIDNDVSELILRDLKAKTIDVAADSGDVTIQNAETDNLILSADIGDIRGTGIKAAGTEVEVSTGEVYLEGTFAGKTTINCDIGDCTLTTTLPKEAYSLKTESDLGSCTIDGMEVGGAHEVQNLQAANSIHAQCDTGEVNLNFAR